MALRSVTAFVMAASVAGGAARAAAQTTADPYGRAYRRIAIGAEFSGTIAPRDPGSFFDYSDYERDDLRLARLRVLAEWHLHPRASLLAEVRSENGNGVDAAAWYLRWRPLASHDFVLQVGRIPPVIGAFARRAYGRDNLVIGTPLAYSYLTSLRPDALPGTSDDLLKMRGRGWEPSFPIGSQATAPGIPLISAARWDKGLQARWRVRRFELTGALTEHAPATPALDDSTHGPASSMRVALEAAPGWTVGVSAARGQWIQHDVLSLATATSDFGRQTLVAMDTEISRYRWIIRAEAIRSTFELPLALILPHDTHVTAWSAFLEARYRLSARWQVAARADRLAFGAPPYATAIDAPSWDARVTRAEAIVGYRAFRRLDLRAGYQYNWRNGGRLLERGIPMVQTLFWF